MCELDSWPMRLLSKPPSPRAKSRRAGWRKHEPSFLTNVWMQSSAACSWFLSRSSSSLPYGNGMGCFGEERRRLLRNRPLPCRNWVQKQHEAPPTISVAFPFVSRRDRRRERVCPTSGVDRENSFGRRMAVLYRQPPQSEIQER